jgi:hypothetical protein
MPHSKLRVCPHSAPWQQPRRRRSTKASGGAGCLSIGGVAKTGAHETSGRAWWNPALAVDAFADPIVAALHARPPRITPAGDARAFARAWGRCAGGLAAEWRLAAGHLAPGTTTRRQTHTASVARARTEEPGSQVARRSRGASGPSGAVGKPTRATGAYYGADFPHAKKGPSMMRLHYRAHAHQSLSVFCSCSSGANHRPRHHHPEMISSRACSPTRLNAAAPDRRLAHAAHT